MSGRGVHNTDINAKLLHRWAARGTVLPLRACGVWRLHGRLRVAVAGEALHVDVVRRQRVARGVGVVDAGRVREPLGQRRLLAERLRERRVGQWAARVQPLPERVHHADLRARAGQYGARACVAPAQRLPLDYSLIQFRERKWS